MSQIVGILGGMGPEATVELMKRVIQATPAQDDCDHIHMIVDNNPGVPSRIKAILEGSGDDPASVLIEMAQRLEKAGANFLVMPCNTAHYYHAKVQSAVSIPMWDIIQLTTAYLNSLPGSVKNIGILASSATQKIGLFQPYFDSAGLTLIYPEPEYQDKVMATIRAVKANEISNAVLSDFDTAVKSLENGEIRADALVLACTELALLGGVSSVLPVIDTLQLLVNEIVDQGVRKNPDS